MIDFEETPPDVKELLGKHKRRYFLSRSRTPLDQLRARLPPLPVSVAVDTKLQVRPGFAPNERAAVRAIAGEMQIDDTITEIRTLAS